MKTTLTLLLVTIYYSVSSQSSNWFNYTCSNKIYDLSAKGDKLWVSTIGGCATVDQSTGDVKHYNRANTGLPDIFVGSMYVAENENMWFDIHTRGITKFDGVNWLSYNQLNSNISSDNIANIREDAFGNVWMLCINTNSIVKFDGINWFTYNSTNTSLPSEYIRFFEIDNSGKLWIITGYSGLVQFDESSLIVYNTTNSQIPSNSISALAIDDIGNVWLGFNGLGISKFDGVNWNVYNMTNSQIPSDSIGTIVIENSIVWGTYNEQFGGIFRFDGINWTDFNSNNSALPAEDFLQFEITSNGDKWLVVGDWPTNKLIQFDGLNVENHDITNSPLIGNIILDIDFDSDGKLWIADYGQNSNGGQLVAYQNHNWENYHQQTSVSWLQHQNDSVIWLGMYNRIGRC